MKRVVMLFAALLFSSVAFAETKDISTDVPVFKEGEDYASVRVKMMEAGWEPYHSEDADVCSEGDKRCEGRPEMEACAGTGEANCRFLWRKGDGQVAICTVGEDPAVFDGRCE